MQVQRYHVPAEFYQDAEAFLVRHEAVNNLLIGLTTGMIRNPTLHENPYFAVVRQDGEIVGTSLRTPPYNLILANIDSQAAVKALVEDAHAVYETLRGILGTKQNSAYAASLWEEQSGQKAQLSMLERIYQLERVITPQGVSGSLRKADEPDRELMRQWLINFQIDAFPGGKIDMAAVDRGLDNALVHKARDYYFWEDVGQPVALVGYSGFTPNGVRIGPVYTPTDQRRRGYGSAATAAVSQMLLDSGRRFCFLFTDLKNPTSNHIYQTIGYEPVCDIDEWVFS